MNPPVHNDDSAWEQVLGQALAGCARAPAGLLLFREVREDLALNLDPEEGPPVSDHNRMSGLSVRGPFDGGRLVYQGEPEHTDAERLLRMAVDPRLRAPGTQPAILQGEPRSPALQTATALQCLETLVHRASLLQPRAFVRASWIGFEQRVQVAQPGRAVASDCRRGCRVRLEVRVEAPRHRALAVGEAVLESGSAAGNAALERLCAGVVQRVERRMLARALSSGDRQIVFAPGVGGVLIHEIVGHALEADAALGGTSWLARTTDKVAPDDLLILDDPRRARGAGHLDDEGEQPRPTPLIRGGRVAGWLHDQRSARQCDQQPTGHGRRASYRDPVRPRMGCTFVASGEHTPAEVIDGISEGIYVRRMESARTDPASGEAVFRVTDSDLIRQGNIDAPLKPHLVRIDAKSALAAMNHVGNDLAFDTCIGSCLRDGQAIAISVGAPTFCIGLASVLF